MIHYPQGDGRRQSRISGVDTHHVVLVEGIDDALVYEKIFLNRFLDNDFEIFVAGGYREMRTLVPTLLRVRGSKMMRSLTLARDSDNSPQQALSSMQTLFAENQLNVPSIQLEVTSGPIASVFPKTVATGILLMPQSSPGAVESLLFDNHVFSQAKPVIDDAFLPAINGIDPPSATAREFTAGKHAKRRFGILMSLGHRRSNTPPGLSLRTALHEYDVFDINGSPIFQAYRDYVASLPA